MSTCDSFYLLERKGRKGGDQAHSELKYQRAGLNMIGMVMFFYIKITSYLHCKHIMKTGIMIMGKILLRGKNDLRDVHYLKQYTV